MSGKLTKEASDRLVNLLYSTTSTEIASKVPIVTKYLYTNEETTPIKSALEGLMENEWNQRPMVRAVDEVPVSAKPAIKSNILRFNCTNSFLTKDDFWNIFPINRERQYLLPPGLRDGLRFHVVKARDPLSLLFQNSYYLIFPNHVQACVYLNETTHKAINGVPFVFKFHEASKTKLKYMASPFLGVDGQNLTATMDQQQALNKQSISNPFHDLQSTTINHVSMDQIFKYSPTKLSILEQLGSIENPDYKSLETHPNYNLLGQLVDSSTRANSVLVKNLPFGLSKHTLPRLLWNYDLLRKNPITTIINNPVKQIHLQLIRFENSASSDRFVRNFHGKRWDSMQHHQDEKKFYEPILCEVVD